MTLTIPNLDRITKASSPLGEAIQKQQSFANQTVTAKGNYVSTATYSQGDTVLSVGIYYRSLVNANVGNTPASSPSTWQAIGTAQLAAPTFVRI